MPELESPGGLPPGGSQHDTPNRTPIARSLLLFAASFVAMAGLLHLVVHALAGDTLSLYAGGRSEKLALMQSWRGKDFSATFGTSHIANGFDPRVFDRELTGSPLATHSVNLALIGGSQTEQRKMALEWVRHLVTPAEAGAAPQPCFVILELNAGANLPSFDIVHPRAINIYDWQSTHLVTRMVEPSMPRTQRIGRIGMAFLEMGLHDMNLGMLSNFIFKPSLDREILDEETRDDRRGLLVESTPAAPASDVSSVTDVAPPTPVVDHLRTLPGNVQMIEELDRASRAKYYAPVYLVSPHIKDVAETHLYPDHLTVNGREVPIINMARHDLYPQFYDWRLWHDGAHFDAAGSTMFSKAFADALKAWYAQHGGPAPCH